MQTSPPRAELSTLLIKLQHGELFTVNPRRKNGVILCKRYHGEFAGPGAVIGGVFDGEVERIIPVGHLSLLTPRSPEERTKGYLLRRQWIRLFTQITNHDQAVDRAKVILNQFENWFDSETAAQLSDDTYALLVGVLPQTIRKVRNQLDRLDV